MTLKTGVENRNVQGVGAASKAADTGRYLALMAAVLGWMFDGLEMGLFPLVARPALLELLGQNAQQHMGTWISAIIAVFLVGASFGGFVFGALGDRIGRTKAMVWSVLAYSIFSGACAFVHSPEQMLVLRFLAALGMGGEWALGVALVMEIWPAKSRPLLAGIIGASANAGFLLIALMSLALTSVIGFLSVLLGVLLPTSAMEALLANGAWRMLMLLGAMPALLTFFIRLWVPESPKWKEVSEKNPPAWGEVFRLGGWKKVLIGASLGSIVLMGTWGSIQWIPSWAHKLSNGAPGVREWVQIASAIGAILGNLFAAWLAEKIARRPAFFFLSLASLITCAILFRSDLHYGTAFLVWTFIVGGLTASFFGWLPLYLPELFPTRVRAAGTGIAFNAGRILAAGGALISGALLNRFHEDYARMLSVISLVYVLGLVVIWFAPETKGKPLPE